MSKTRKVTIATKRMFGRPTESAIKFTTSGYGGNFFNIPHSQIVSRKRDDIKVNENYDEPAVEYEISSWIFGKIKEYLEKMSKHHCIIKD
jgi:hypothetical protein